MDGTRQSSTMKGLEEQQPGVGVEPGEELLGWTVRSLARSHHFHAWANNFSKLAAVADDGERELPKELAALSIHSRLGGGNPILGPVSATVLHCSAASRVPSDHLQTVARTCQSSDRCNLLFQEDPVLRRSEKR